MDWVERLWGGYDFGSRRGGVSADAGQDSVTWPRTRGAASHVMLAGPAGQKRGTMLRGFSVSIPRAEWRATLVSVIMTEMDFSAEIERLADTFRRSGLSVWSPQDPKWPDEIVRGIARACEAIEKSLDANDRKEYGQRAVIYGRWCNSDGKRDPVAVAKTLSLIDAAYRAKNVEKLIRQDFSDSELFRRFPELQAHLTADALFPAALFGCFKDVFSYRGYALVPIGLTPAPLKSEISKLAQQKTPGLRFAIDHFLIRPESQYFEAFGKARIWGLPFSSRVLLERIYERRSISVYKRCPVDEIEKLTFTLRAPVERLEVCRAEQAGGVSTRIALLIEELPPLAEDHLELGYVLTRMFHCDLELGAEKLDDLRFMHVDASLLVYSVESYIERLDTPGEKVKAVSKTKLFYLPDARYDQWRDLLIATFPNDELVGDWLTGEKQAP